MKPSASSIFNNLAFWHGWSPACLSTGMNFLLILLALQVVVVIASFVRERGEDKTFEGDKVGFRS